MNSSQNQIRAAAKALIDGNLVIFPTETVYGLGADALNPRAVDRIYEIKNRPKTHKLIVHISSANRANFWTDVDDRFSALANAFWPGPLTILTKTRESSFIQNSVGQKVALRSPANSMATQLLIEFEILGGNGVVAPSANRFGKLSPTTSDAAKEFLGPYLAISDLILDEGKCNVGIESTIIDITQRPAQILRRGLVTQTQLKEVLKEKIYYAQQATKENYPGTSKKHYMPKNPVVLNGVPKSGDAFIALAETETPKGAIRISSPKTILDFAAELYDSLRKSDTILGGRGEIHVNFHGQGEVAEAILERLTKAVD